MDNGVEYQDFNHGFTAFLLIVDVLSNFVFTRPLKDKSATEVTNAFRDVVKQTGRRPLILTVDAGRYLSIINHASGYMSF